MATLESNQQVLAAAAAAEDKKAEDIRILELDPSESGLCDYFIICNGTNERQNVAIADEIEFRLKKDFGVYANSVEGRRQAEWILLDYVDFVVHIFSAEKRAFYGLERLRKSATTLSIATLNAEVTAAIAASRQRRSRKPPVTAASKPPAKQTSVSKSVAKTVKAKATTAKGKEKKSVARKPVGKKAVAGKSASKKIASSGKTVATKRPRKA